MISLIICSRKSDIPYELKENINTTIGVKYELVIIDNSKNEYTIFQAYNLGVTRAKYPYLCFMHEDILFHTDGWGKKVLIHFENKIIGLIGVVGGHYLPDCPASWWSTECKSGQFAFGYSDPINKHTVEVFKWLRNKSVDEKSTNVVTVDGLWFCIPRKLFDLISFDDSTFSGFHCYDTDICMQINELGLDVRVIFDILIEHTSWGNQDENFIAQRELCYRKWSHKLPMIRGIQLTEYEIIDRCELVKEINKEHYMFISSQNEIKKIRSSKAYRLGKFILKPFSILRSLK